MLFNLLTSFIEHYSFLNVFKYLTFRTGLSVVTSLVVVFIIGGPLIRIFSENMISGPIRQDGPIDHIIKKSDILFIRPYNYKGVNIKNYKNMIGKKLKINVKKLNIIKMNYFNRIL